MSSLRNVARLTSTLPEIANILFALGKQSKRNSVLQRKRKLHTHRRTLNCG